MPIQIPSLQKIAPQAPDSMGRISTDAPSEAKATALKTEAVSGFVNQYADYQAKAEEHAAETIARKAASEYEIRTKVEFNKINSLEGDPTQAYNDFNSNLEKWKTEILEANGSASPRAKQLIQEKMIGSDYFNGDNRAVVVSSKYSKFQDGEFDKYNSLLADRVLNQSQFIQKGPKGDVSGLSDLQVGINEIKENITKWGEIKGIVTTDAEGKKNYSEAAKYEMKKRVSSTLNDVISTLSNSGRTEEAQQVMELFKADLTADDMVKLTKHKNENEVDKAAWSNVYEITKKFPSNLTAQRKALEKLPVEVRAKAEAHLVTYNKQLKDTKDLQSGLALEDGIKRFSESARLAAKKTPFTTIDEMRSSPEYKTLTSKMDDKDIKALEQHFFEPDVSSHDAEMEVSMAVANDSLVEWTPTQLARVRAKLDRQGRNNLDKMWNDLQSDTSSEKRELLKDTTKMLTQEIRRLGLANVDAKGGSPSKKERNKYIELLNEWTQETGTWRMGDSPDERLRNVQRFVEAKKKGVAFPGSEQGKRRFESAPEKPKVQETPKPQEALSMQEMVEWKKKYEVKRGKKFDPRTDMKDMQKFIQSGGKD